MFLLIVVVISGYSVLMCFLSVGLMGFKVLALCTTDALSRVVSNDNIQFNFFVFILERQH